MLKTVKQKFIALVLTSLVLFVSTLLIFGRSYTVTIEPRTFSELNSLEDVSVVIEQEDQEYVVLTGETLENGTLSLTFASKSRGKVFVDVYVKDESFLFRLYVHRFGIITYGDFFGDTTGDEIIPLTATLLLFFAFYHVIKKYRQSRKENPYSYRNIFLLGLIFFLSPILPAQILQIFNYTGLYKTAEFFLSSTTAFSTYILPIAFLVFLFVSVTNIILLIREGYSWKNALGFFLGLFLCLLTIAPELANRALQTSMFIDIHRQSAIWPHLFRFFESGVYFLVTYLECILLSTIILSVRSARHLPARDKDFLVILGCRMRDNGSLTNILRARVDRAIEFANLEHQETGKELIFVPSGGKGPDEPLSEAKAMRNYLLEKGIKENRILLEDKSKSTFENLKFSKAIIEKQNKSARVAFSTSNYHVFRAGILASSLGWQVEGIGAKTRAYFWLNAFVREYIATLVAERKKHLIIIIFALIVIFSLAAFLYLDANL